MNCLNQGPLGCLFKMHISGSRGPKLIFRGEAWTFVFSAHSPGDFDGFKSHSGIGLQGQRILVESEYLPSS